MTGVHPVPGTTGIHEQIKGLHGRSKRNSCYESIVFVELEKLYCIKSTIRLAS